MHVHTTTHNTCYKQHLHKNTNKDSGKYKQAHRSHTAKEGTYIILKQADREAHRPRAHTYACAHSDSQRAYNNAIRRITSLTHLNSLNHSHTRVRCMRSRTHSHPLTSTPLTSTPTRTHTHSHPHPLATTRTHSYQHPLALTPTRTHTHSHSHPLTSTPTRTHTHTHSHSHLLIPTRIHSHPHLATRTHTYSHLLHPLAPTHIHTQKYEHAI